MQQTITCLQVQKKSQPIILMDKLIIQIIWTQVGFSESSQC